jgi:alanine dehydrogenase
VRSIEGIPQGDLDKLFFLPGDSDWSATIPAEIPTAARRPTVSCYSWPGVHPQECMEVYGKQLLPLLECLVKRGGPAGLSAGGSHLERALVRASLSTWAAKLGE